MRGGGGWEKVLGCRGRVPGLHKLKGELCLVSLLGPALRLGLRL